MWLSLLTALIPSILQFVQAIHPAKKADGSSNGPTKMTAAVALAQNAVSSMLVAGAIPAKAAPTVAEIQAVAQQEFDKLKAAGKI